MFILERSYSASVVALLSCGESTFFHIEAETLKKMETDAHCSSVKRQRKKDGKKEIYTI